jgi:O-antigen/teichoic acid export membrane protein
VVSQNFDIVVVGTMLGTTVAGYYGAAAQLAVLVHFGVNAVLFMAAPLISELYARDDRAGLQRLVTLTARMNLALSVPVIIGLLIGGRLALSWYGPSMVAGYPVLVVLLAGQLAGTGVGSLAGFLMTMTGHQNRAAAIIGASAVLYLVLAAVLTRAFGAVGTASATVIALLVRGIALDFEVRRLLGLEASAFGRHRPLATAQASAGLHAPEPGAHADAQPVISR